MIGRDTETRLLGEMLSSASRGSGAVVVLLGEAGVGKTALIDGLVSEASDFDVLRIAGVETEAELGYAGLHRLLLPLLPYVDDLPVQQRDALRAALGLAEGDASNRFLVGLAALTLLSERAQGRPILCIIDDAQWVDGESLELFAFVARRLLADRIAMMFASRSGPGSLTPLTGLPALSISGLNDAAARLLLSQHADGVLTESVAERIVEETGGNPLALIELCNEFPASELNRHGLRPEPLPVGTEIERRYLRRIRDLPRTTQTLLLVAAADPTGEPGVLQAGGDRLGIDISELGPALDSGLITIDERVAFRHPLVRSALYRSVPPSERRTIHAALAEVAAPSADPENRAWHLVAATEFPDEDVAAFLSRAARAVGARGGNQSQVELLLRASRLSPDPERRERRAFYASAAASMSGHVHRADRILTELMPTMRESYLRASATLLHAELQPSRSEFLTATKLVLDAAVGMDAYDRDQARSAALSAAMSISLSRQETLGVGVSDLAIVLRGLPKSEAGPDSVFDLLFDGYLTAFEEGFPAAAPLLRQAIDRWPNEIVDPVDIVRWLLLAVWAAWELFDHDAVRSIVDSGLRIARANGALQLVRTLLYPCASAELLAGRFASVAVLHLEQLDLEDLVDSDPHRVALVRHELLAWQGDEIAAREAITELIDAAPVTGYGIGARIGNLALAVLANSTGRYDEAVAACREVVGDPIPGQQSQILPELIEAAVRTGDRPLALAALADLEARVAASGTTLALGVQARARAQLAADDDAEALYLEAIDPLMSTTAVPDLARAQLLYGEWLRRQNRRVDARVQLQVAHDRFVAMGASAFAERARAEIQASGARARNRSVDSSNDLTPQERRTAVLAAAGETNAEIATQLFVSPSTVDYHLRKVFRKLDVTSRHQLATALPD